MLAVVVIESALTGWASQFIFTQNIDSFSVFASATEI